MTTRAVAILLAAAALGGAGVDSSGERVIRLASAPIGHLPRPTSATRKRTP